jgi:hypothetical protein
MLSSTPNGTEGVGKFFYEMCTNAIESDEIYDEDNKLIPEHEQVIANPTKNGFIKINLHWSEVEGKDEAWYLEQCKDLNFNKRKITKSVFLKFFEFGEHPTRLCCGQYRANPSN